MRFFLRSICLLLLSLFAFSGVAMAAMGPSSSGGATAPAASGGGGSKIYTTEKVPGADCVPKGAWKGPKDKLYECTVGKGFSTIMDMLGQMIKYFTYITGLVGVLMIVVCGIQYSLSGGGEEAKKTKGRIIQLIGGLVLLFLVGFILNSIAPWIYK